MCIVIERVTRGSRKPERVGTTIPNKSSYETGYFITDLESQNEVGIFPLTFGRGLRPRPFGIVATKIVKIMEQTKSKRGGRREGAGRKPSGLKKTTVTLSFTPEVVEILRTKGRQQSAYIESLILADMQKDKE